MFALRGLLLCSPDFNNKVKISTHRGWEKRRAFEKKGVPGVGNLIDCYVKSPPIPPPTPTWGEWGITLIVALHNTMTPMT